MGFFFSPVFKWINNNNAEQKNHRQLRYLFATHRYFCFAAADFIVTKRKKLTAEGNSKNIYGKMCSWFSFFNTFADININKYTTQGWCTWVGGEVAGGPPWEGRKGAEEVTSENEEQVDMAVS